MGFLEEYSFVIGFFIVMGVLVWIGDSSRRDFSDMLKRKEKLRMKLDDEIEKRKIEKYEEDSERKLSKLEWDDFYESIDLLKEHYNREIKDVHDNYNSYELKEIRMSLMGILVIVMTGLFLIYNKLWEKNLNYFTKL